MRLLVSIALATLMLIPPASAAPRKSSCDKLPTNVPFPGPGAPRGVPLSQTDQYLEGINVQIEMMREQIAMLQQTAATMALMLCYQGEDLRAMREHQETPH